MGSFRVHVTKDYLVFCAGHFITYDGHSCERLHGHNYRASILLEGLLDENWYVFDFVALKRVMKQLIDALDHRVLLPKENPLIQLSESDGHVTAEYKDRKYTFPREDVALLPIPNTTVEMLAQYLTEQVKKEFVNMKTHSIHSIELEIEESFGQSATYRETLQG